MRPEGTIAIVTRAAGGLGTAITEKLAGDGASYLTGQDITVDGGLGLYVL